MNNPNPFVPQGSLLEQQSKRRSRLKLAVLCVLVVGVASLTAMLIQGCKREQVSDQNQPPVETNMMVMDTNPPPMMASNPPVPPPPVVPPPPPVVENAGTEYVVVSHDTLAKIAKRHGVTLKALEAANPGIDPNKLKVGQKLTIPAGGSTSAAPGVSTSSESGAGGGTTYVVKSNDNLTKIARTFGTTVKAIQTENNLSTTRIHVGQKLKIPAKAEAAAPAPAPAPMMPPPPPPGTAPAPAGTPAGQ
ncbi:MAG TPA: LysM peptidoglycan-binding domain-containing protein [Candidatus Acidoferrum sp.]|nr:LysM peptidoglycan-binding domain-containing protein [Candidatus Acidoferrum sp.]